MAELIHVIHPSYIPALLAAGARVSARFWRYWRGRKKEWAGPLVAAFMPQPLPAFPLAQLFNHPDGAVVDVRVMPESSPALNPAFDVTPARLVSGLITERGVCPASAEGLLSLYPERRTKTAP